MTLPWMALLSIDSISSFTATFLSTTGFYWIFVSLNAFLLYLLTKIITRFIRSE